MHAHYYLELIHSYTLFDCRLMAGGDALFHKVPTLALCMLGSRHVKAVKYFLELTVKYGNVPRFWNDLSVLQRQKAPIKRSPTRKKTTKRQRTGATKPRTGATKSRTRATKRRTGATKPADSPTPTPSDIQQFVVQTINGEMQKHFDSFRKVMVMQQRELHLAATAAAATIRGSAASTSASRDRTPPRSPRRQPTRRSPRIQSRDHRRSRSPPRSPRRQPTRRSPRIQSRDRGRSRSLLEVRDANLHVALLTFKVVIAIVPVPLLEVTVVPVHTVTVVRIHVDSASTSVMIPITAHPNEVDNR